MAPEQRFVCRFAAEPPQSALPYGRWAQRLTEVLAEATDEALEGEPTWYPDRTWHGRTYVPCTARTAAGEEVVGYVSFRPAPEDGEPDGFAATAEVVEETAADHPEWSIDLNEEVVGGWRGEAGTVAAMTLVWGVPLVAGGAIATAELADLAVDQCVLLEGRFTLLAPDDFRGDVLDVKVFGQTGDELARESLYEEE